MKTGDDYCFDERKRVKWLLNMKKVDLNKLDKSCGSKLALIR